MDIFGNDDPESKWPEFRKMNATGGSKQTQTIETPMLNRAMRQKENQGLKTWFHADFPKEDGFSEQPDSLLRTIERSLKDIYEWACENQKDNQGLLYDLNTAIAAVERCGVKIKDGRS
ncbi:MAG TPA: hypothetical protein VJ248_02125 [Candidatus Udaeobacter sp.]|nr:hypothetical protein [Candidatus Udaeobacter sp.]